ncbi:FMN-binding protein [Bifidobacterium thermophilum]|uniref:FMN-binding protein n=1 Tax=Bifidobacterium thermophilum TaxID=33905 RepID=UPI003BB4BF46
MAAVGLVAATSLFGGCGSSEAIPMNDEYAGNSGESSAVPDSSGTSGSDGASGASGSSGWSSLSGSASPSASASEDSKDSGDYRDGTYSVNSKYGPVNEDSIDVKVTVKDQKIADVEVTGHPFTPISKKHQDAFAKAIPGVVVGKKLKGLDVDTVAGASWTTEAFNKALATAREQASE